MKQNDKELFNAARKGDTDVNQSLIEKSCEPLINSVYHKFRVNV